MSKSSDRPPGGATSQLDVEQLLAGYAAFAAGDLETTLALLDPEIVVTVHTDRPDIGSERYHGHEGFLANFSELTDVFDDLEVRPGEVQERPGGFMVDVFITGRGKGSGVPIEARIFHVWTIREALATKLEIFSDREQALAAFGG